MKTPIKKGKHSIGKIILVVWVVFSIIYIGWSQYNYFRNFVYQKGLTDAVTEVIRQGQECKAFPVALEGQGVQLINIACLTQPQGEDAGE